MDYNQSHSLQDLSLQNIMAATLQCQISMEWLDFCAIWLQYHDNQHQDTGMIQSIVNICLCYGWHSHLALAIYMFVVVVVNFDALAQASDLGIEREQVVFLCWIEDPYPGSLEPNLQQTECPLTYKNDDINYKFIGGLIKNICHGTEIFKSIMFTVCQHSLFFSIVILWGWSEAKRVQQFPSMCPWFPQTLTR